MEPSTVEFYVNMLKRADGDVYPDLHKTDGRIYATEDAAQAAIEAVPEWAHLRHPVRMVAHVATSYYAITGRVCGDDEDTLRVYCTTSCAAAMRSFIEDMWADEPVSQEERERLEANGEGVFVNSVVRSDSPIEEM